MPDSRLELYAVALTGVPFGVVLTGVPCVALRFNLRNLNMKILRGKMAVGETGQAVCSFLLCIDRNLWLSASIPWLSGYGQ